MNTSSETVGRKFNRVYFSIQNRKVEGSGHWYGASRYNTKEEAVAAIHTMGRYQDIGGITVDLGKAIDLYEYRIVKVESACEVVHVETREL